jgi:ABC-type multidrug transport system ATPase subunit
MEPPRLEIRGVGKRYGRSWAVRDVSLDLNPGVLGLLGPNGAGKSTLMRILATVLRPTAGQVRWDGVDALRHPQPLRRVLGYLPQDFGVYPHLNAVEFLGYIAALKGMSWRDARRRIAELVRVLNLEQVRRRPLGAYSRGMRQRVGIAQALLNDPRLLIVDEPTAGLDPEERVNFRNLIGELAADRIVMLSTHIVSDVEASATQIALMVSGILVACERPADLLRSVRGRVWEVVVAGPELPRLRQQYAVSETTQHEDGVRVRVISDRSPDPRAVSAEPRLEDVYLHQIAARRGEVALSSSE